MENLNLFNYLKGKSILILNAYGYSEAILDDDDYLHDFLIDFRSMFNNEELEVLLAYNTIFQFRVANQIEL